MMSYTICTNFYNTLEFKHSKKCLNLVTVIMNPTDEGHQEKQFPQDFRIFLRKCKQPSCILSFTFSSKPSSFIKGQFLEMRKSNMTIFFPTQSPSGNLTFV